MDYSLCNAMAYNTLDLATGLLILQFLVIYDVACQYSINFKTRIESSTILKQLVQGIILSITWAVGKFHLGAHKDECYAEFSLNHKEGAGLEDGETLEEAEYG